MAHLFEVSPHSSSQVENHDSELMNHKSSLSSSQSELRFTRPASPLNDSVNYNEAMFKSFSGSIRSFSYRSFSRTRSGRSSVSELCQNDIDGQDDDDDYYYQQQARQQYQNKQQAREQQDPEQFWDGDEDQEESNGFSQSGRSSSNGSIHQHEYPEFSWDQQQGHEQRWNSNSDQFKSTHNNQQGQGFSWNPRYDDKDINDMFKDIRKEVDIPFVGPRPAKVLLLFPSISNLHSFFHLQPKRTPASSITAIFDPLYDDALLPILQQIVMFKERIAISSENKTSEDQAAKERAVWIQQGHTRGIARHNLTYLLKQSQAEASHESTLDGINNEIYEINDEMKREKRCSDSNAADSNSKVETLNMQICTAQDETKALQGVSRKIRCETGLELISLNAAHDSKLAVIEAEQALFKSMLSASLSQKKHEQADKNDVKAASLKEAQDRVDQMRAQILLQQQEVCVCQSEVC